MITYTSVINRDNGAKFERQFENLITKKGFKVVNPHLEDIDLISEDLKMGFEVKSGQLIRIDTKFKDRFMPGLVTFRLDNHQKFFEKCKIEGLLPIYVFFILYNDSPRISGFLSWEDVDAIMKKSKFIKEGKKSDKKGITVMYFLPGLKPLKQLIEVLKK